MINEAGTEGTAKWGGGSGKATKKMDMDIDRGSKKTEKERGFPRGERFIGRRILALGNAPQTAP